VRLRTFLAASALAVGAVSLGAGFIAGAASATQNSGGSFHTATLSGHECNSTQWQFVITQIDGTAPSSITVSWSNGTSSTVGLSGQTGSTAHYITSAHLGDGVKPVGASVSLPEGTTIGNFNLSDGPCGTNGGTTTTSSSTPASSTPPSSEPPSSAPPSSEPPSSAPPSSAPPSSAPPSSQPPSTQPPSTQPPSTQPPSTQPPSTEPPVVRPTVAVPGQDTAAPTAAPTTLAPATALPVTGSSSGLLILVGAVSLLIGGMLVLMGRRPATD
jgi:LPXTG-motif cell wall-anchored protein